MLDEKDYKEIAHLMSVLIENEVKPRFDLLAEGQKNILETLAPKSRVEELEDEVKFLKSMIRRINEDVQKLQTAN